MKSRASLLNESRREVPQKRGKNPAGRVSLSVLKSETYDLIVIGGGITGATILWDAALRGMKAVLLERNDYASGTTQATSKLIHGGLRYLKNGEFGLVRESLRERRTLAHIAPHALRPEAFLMPLYKKGTPGSFLMGTALKLYDLLSFDRNRGISDDLKLPASRYLNRTETLAEEPGILAKDLKGAFVYYDYANVNPERLCSEFIFSARAMGARARNYTEATGIVHQTDSGYAVAVRDRQTGERATITGRSVVNAGGPWADYIEDMVSGSNHHKLRRSRGIHAVTKRIVHDKTVVLFREDKTHLFLIPWRNRTIIGTTDATYDGHPDGLRVTKSDVQDLIGGVNRLFGGHRLGMEDVFYSYAGLRPLVEETSSGSTYNASRKTEIHHHKN
ncbi:MAG: glycerol-3-phosphate dehydrogenase/oxidase, partial [Spirochaetia bacterium]|nr:glycerol-3-phosphate dehydrogenase/oxidase [Spirochaetia bacterium]